MVFAPSGQSITDITVNVANSPKTSRAMSKHAASELGIINKKRKEQGELLLFFHMNILEVNGDPFQELGGDTMLFADNIPDQVEITLFQVGNHLDQFLSDLPPSISKPLKELDQALKASSVEISLHHTGTLLFGVTKAFKLSALGQSIASMLKEHTPKGFQKETVPMIFTMIYGACAFSMAVSSPTVMRRGVILWLLMPII